MAKTAKPYQPPSSPHQWRTLFTELSGQSGIAQLHLLAADSYDIAALALQICRANHQQRPADFIPHAIVLHATAVSRMGPRSAGPPIEHCKAPTASEICNLAVQLSDLSVDARAVEVECGLAGERQGTIKTRCTPSVAANALFPVVQFPACRLNEKERGSPDFLGQAHTLWMTAFIALGDIKVVLSCGAAVGEEEAAKELGITTNTVRSWLAELHPHQQELTSRSKRKRVVMDEQMLDELRRLQSLKDAARANRTAKAKPNKPPKKKH